MAEIGGINVTATRVSSAKVSIAMAQVSAVATRVESRFTGAGMLAVGLGILGGALAAMLQAQIAWPGLAFIGGLS
ncbi:MAG: hypothetical protein IT378_12730 [Sandaracinaceae bacterium]|nr:hypothetical protein [Sandaracinaceae bacterium]